MADYDLGEAFKAIEEELIASMIRNMDHHRAEETKEGIQWSQWQVEQLNALEEYRRENREKFNPRFRDINAQIPDLIDMARQQGGMDQEASILEAMKQGLRTRKTSDAVMGEFFTVNDRKLNALVNATQNDFSKAEHAVLRMADDKYRKAIFNAQVYANAGGTTYEKAVDMATRDMLRAGLNCVEYKNGARHTLSDYADMCLKTATKRAYLTGEGEKRKEWGIATVIMNKRGNPCPLCAPWCGKVLIDDVWSGGKPDGKHPLMSTAIEKGLYHPRCKDVHTTYFPGISTADDPYDRKEREELVEDYNQEQKQSYYERQAEQCERIGKYSLDPDNKRMYEERAKQWKGKLSSNENIKDKETSVISKIAKTIDKKKRQIHELRYDFEPITLDQLPVEHRVNVRKIIRNAPKEVQDLISKYQNQIKIISFNPYKGKNHFSREEKAIRFNLAETATDVRGAYRSLFHEMGHNIDYLLGDVSCTRNFRNALINDFGTVVNNYMKMYNCDIQTAYSGIGKKIRDDKYHSISDLVDMITDGACRGRYRHEENYRRKKNRLEMEAFAHFFEAYTRNDVEKLEALEEMFPNAINLFYKMIGGK